MHPWRILDHAFLFITHPVDVAESQGHGKESYGPAQLLLIN